jgi:thiamine pyrophosphokinase
MKVSQNLVVSDGGANRIYHSPFRNSEKIRSIVGDLDSITDSTLDFYQKKGVEILKIPNQNMNDF